MPNNIRITDHAYQRMKERMGLNKKAAKRMMSIVYKKAKSELSMDEYKKEMAGVYTTSVNESTLDEAPMAYKSLEDIIDVIRESVYVIDVMKPIYNFKASD